ncbi:MAG TPA: hypothetical protein VIN03_26745 [Roseateles sp.]
MRRTLLFLALASPLVGQGAWALDCPEPLRIGFTDRAAPPALLGNGTQFADPPGWGVASMRDALRRLGCNAELVRLPRRRLSSALDRGEVHFAALFGATPERLRSYSFPLDAEGRPDAAWAPAFGHLALYSRAGTTPDPAWDGINLPRRWRVGVLAGSVQEALAGERGWTVEPIATFENEVAMLQVQRFDLLLTTREALSPEQRAELVEWSPLAAWLPYFAPATPGFVQRHGAWTRAFWAELCQAVRRLEPEVRPVDCGVAPPAPRR